MTELTDFQRELSSHLPDIRLCFWESMAKHTSFRIGGEAEIMAFPKTEEELSRILKMSKILDCKPVMLGAGTNVLAPDEGIPGLVVCLKDSLIGCERLEGNRVRCMAGVTMSRGAVFAANHNLGGLEFAHGIPGTMGGGVYMNAGAYGGELCQVVEQVEVMDICGCRRALSREEMGFSYRHSVLEDSGEIVLAVTFQLEEKPAEAVWARMKELIGKRSASQPLDLPSAGSAFKRPAGGYAAALIDQAGLKGFRVGNAAISEKHAGFAVNMGGATAADVKRLLKAVSDKVYENSGIRLEPEIRIW